MTTTDAAAARRTRYLAAFVVAIGLAGSGLAGCGSSLFNTATATPEPTPAPKKAVVEAPVAKVAINAIVGPPDPLGKQLSQEFAAALESQRIAVAAGRDDKVDYNLRPYILAAKEKGNIKVSYVLDVSVADPAKADFGKRVGRFAGEEMVPAGGAQDPWTSITPTVAQSIAAKAAGSFAAWLPNAQAVASNAGGGPPAGRGEVLLCGFETLGFMEGHEWLRWWRALAATARRAIRAETPACSQAGGGERVTLTHAKKASQ